MDFIELEIKNSIDNFHLCYIKEYKKFYKNNLP